MSAVQDSAFGQVVIPSQLNDLRSAVVSSSGTLAATYGTDAEGRPAIAVWDAASQLAIERLTLSQPVVAARFAPDESAVIIAQRDNQSAAVMRWSFRTPGLTPETLLEAVEVGGIAVSRDSRTVVLRSRLSGFAVLDTVTRESRSVGEATHFDRVAVSPHGKTAIASVAGRVEIYSLDAPAVTVVGQAVTRPMRSMDCSDDLVVAAAENSVSVVWADNITQPYTVFDAPQRVRRIAVSTGGGVVAVVYDSGFALVELLSGRVLMEQPTQSPIVRLTFQLNDELLVTADKDSNAVLWQLPDLPRRTKDYVSWQSDAPSSEDRLQRKPLAHALAARLRKFQQDQAGASFLVHIDGPWGSGKSTLLRLLRKELEGADSAHAPFLSVDFNAWQQSKVGASWWALLSALRRDMVRNLNWRARWWLRTREAWNRFQRAGAPFALAFVVLVALAVGFFFLLRPGKVTFASSADIARGVGALLVPLATLWAGSKVAARFFLWDSAQGARLYEQSSDNPMLDISRHFGWLLGTIRKPVVFYIDDLDRCGDAYVVELLETVQTLVRNPPAGGSRPGGAHPPTFVVAADGAWIRRSFESAYSQFSTSVAAPGVPLGYLFLDKLFQLRARVPQVDPARQRTYLKQLLQGTPSVTLSADAEANVEKLRTRLRRSSSEADVVMALDGASPEVREQLASEALEKLTSPPVVTATEHYLEQFAPLLPPNPRSMKRFINDYTMLRAVRTLEGSTVGVAPLALWAIIETRWPSLADYLCEHPEAIGQQRDPSRPGDLQSLLDDPEFCELASFIPGGLTEELIAECCGAKFSV